jgi:hypothetical protein
MLSKRILSDYALPIMDPGPTYDLRNVSAKMGFADIDSKYGH